MIKKIAHIGIAVKSIDEVSRFYRENLGLEAEALEVIESQKVKIAFIPIGETRIELLESTDLEGPISKFIQNRGEGIHHIALETNNIEADLETIKSKGIKLLDNKPKQGAHGTKIAFLHPKATFGAMLELCEQSE